MLNLKIGADPEFGLLQDGRCMGAANYFSGTRLGVDGGGTVAEVRPVASYEPIRVVDSIRTAFVTGVKNAPKSAELVWKAGNMAENQCIGGHIHFGTKEFPRLAVNHGELAKCMDIFLTQIVVLLEKKTEAARRRGSYGRLSDMRQQSWGWEYRTLGSWLTSPRVALGVLSLAKVVATEYLEKGNAVYAGESINATAYQNTDKRTFRAKAPKLWKTIETFRLYKKFDEPIGFIRKLIDEERTWFPAEMDMKEAWGLDVEAKLKKLFFKSADAEEIWK